MTSIKQITGLHLKSFVTSYRSCRFDNDGCLLEGKAARLKLNFSGVGEIERCDLVFSRKSGNGLFKITEFKNSGIHNKNHVVSSKSQEIIEPDFSNFKSFELSRTAHSSGDIKLIEVNLYFVKNEAKSEGNWKELLSYCKHYKNLKVSNGRLFASHGAYLDGCYADIVLKTRPANMYKKSGSRLVFLGSCEVLSYSLGSGAKAPPARRRNNQNIFKHRNKPTPSVRRPNEGSGGSGGKVQRYGRDLLLGTMSEVPVGVIFDTVDSNGLKALNASAVTSSLVRLLDVNNKSSLCMSRGALIRQTIPALSAGLYYTVNFLAKKITGNGFIEVGIMDRSNRVITSESFRLSPQLKEAKCKLHAHAELSSGNAVPPFKLFIKREAQRSSGDIVIARVTIANDGKVTYAHAIPSLDSSIISPLSSKIFEKSNIDNFVSKKYNDDLIYATSKLFARYYIPDSDIKFTKFNNNIAVTTPSGFLYYNKLKAFCPNLKLLNASNGLSKGSLLIGEVGMLVPSSHIWVDSFDKISLSKDQLEVLKKSKVIYTPCLENFELLKTICPDARVHLKCKPLFAMTCTKDKYFKNNKYVLMFYRDDKSLDFVIRNWKDSYPKIFLVGGRGAYPSFIQSVNEYMPYKKLLYVIQMAEFVLDIDNNVNYISSFMNMINFFKIPILTSNLYLKQKSNTVYLNKDKFNGLDSLIDDISKIKNNKNCFHNKDEINKYNNEVLDKFNIL